MQGKLVRFSDDWLIGEFGHAAVVQGDIPVWAKQVGTIEYTHRNNKAWLLCGIRWNDGQFSTVSAEFLADLNGQPIT